MTPSFSSTCQVCLAPADSGAETCAKCGAALTASPTSEEATKLLDSLGRALEGRYKIGEILGGGRGGIVTRATVVGSNKDVAIKVAWDDADARTRVLRETVLTGKVQHARVLPMRDIQAPESMFVVEMQLATGGTVADLLADGKPVPYKRVLEIIRGVAEGLDQAHSAGIIHGGLRPVKILLDGEGNPLLTDFEIRLPRRADWDVARPSEVGAQAYMPLEQRHDSPSIDGRADQYALAIIAYELLRGHATWRINHEGVLEIDALDILVHRPVAPDAPLSASTAIKRATAKDPSFRYTSVHAFLQAFSGEAAEVAGSAHTYRDDFVIKQERSFMWLTVPAALVVAIIAMQPSVREVATDYWKHNWSLKARAAADAQDAQVQGNTQVAPAPSRNESERREPSATVANTSTAPASGASNNTARVGDPIAPPPQSPAAASSKKSVAALDPTQSGSPQSDSKGGTGPNGRPRAANSEPSRAVVGGEISKPGSNKVEDTRPGYITVSLDADARAAVIIDGKPRGLTPLTVSIAAGKHTVNLAGGTYSPASAAIDVGPGDTVKTTFGPGRKPK